MGIDNSEISCGEILKRLKRKNADGTDLIVINGGEPSIHKEFQNILRKLSVEDYDMVVYTNGRRLSEFEYENVNKNKIMFIVPIHGNEKTHDQITQSVGSFKETLVSLKYLEESGIKYTVKFILSKEMLQTQFDVKAFLSTHELNPCAIMFSRLNETIKSKKNSYVIEPIEKIYSYLKVQREEIYNFVKLRYLDIPPCKIPVEEGKIMYENKTVLPELHFFFNDANHDMEERLYHKERMQFPQCVYCKYSKLCDFLSNSYYIIEEKNGKLILGRE